MVASPSAQRESYPRHIWECGVAQRRLAYEKRAELQGHAEFHWREINIDADPELRRKYTDEMPVVFIDGCKALKYRMDSRQFLKALQGR
ncbi:MAG: glutaredoxin family protein [Acidobacteriota bacterium]